MPSHRIPLATSFLNRSASLDKDSKIVNGYIERYGEENNAVVKRPGLVVATVGTGGGASGCAQGIYNTNTSVYSASGNLVVDTASEVSPGSYWVRPSTNAFTAGDSLARWRAPALAFNDKIWYLGGGLSDFSQTDDIYSSADAGVTWTKVFTIGTLWTSREDHCACVHNNKIFVIGGWNNTRGNNDVWSSVDGINWVNVAPNDNNYFSGNTQPTVPSSIEQATALSFNNRIYVLGGSVSQVNTPYFLVVNDVWYSVDDGVHWTKETVVSPFTARFAHAACVHNGYMWVAGGNNGTIRLHDVWKSADGINWTQVTAAAGWSARDNLSLQSFAGQLFVTGGDASDLVKNDVWKSSDGATWTQVTTSTNVPATSSYTSVKSAGFVVLNGSLYHIAGSNAISISAVITEVWRTDAPNTITTDPGSDVYCVPVSFNQSGSSATIPYLMYKTSTTGYLLNTTTNITTTITDEDYPALTVPGIVFLDGYFFVMTPDGEIHNSDLEDPTSWSALGFLTAEMEPDAGVAIAKHLNYLVAFGVWTTEFFYDAANALGSPLSRVDNAFMHIGCAAGNSVVEMDNTLVWISQDKQFGRRVSMLHGFGPQVISTPFIDRVLMADDLAAVYAFNAKANGHDFYVLTLKSSNITFAYDFITKTWFQWTSMRAQASKAVTSITLGTDGVTATVTQAAHGYADGDLITIAGANQAAYNGSNNITYIDSSHYSYVVSGSPVSPATGTITSVGYTEGYFQGVSATTSGGVNLIQDETTGTVYELSPSQYTDSGVYINFLVRSPNFDAGNMNTKYISRLEIIGDKEPNSHLLVKYSNDDYVTYSTYRKVDLNSSRSRLNRLGSFKRRSFTYRHTDSTPLRLEGAELIIDREE